MHERDGLIRLTRNGLYCEAGGFYIDPWKGVERAVITHAHADHARRGSKAYLCAKSGMGVLGHRIGHAAPIEGLAWGERKRIGGVTVSLHPAGHILGSAQVRVELGGEVWVVSGDYKTVKDASCEAFEPITCHTFITESTFGLPHYRWRPSMEVFDAINAWWHSNQQLDRTSVLFAYSLGKAQRVLAGIDASSGPIGVHGAVAPFLPLYRAEGFLMPEAEKVTIDNVQAFKGRGLIVAPGSVQNTTWLNRLKPFSLAFASGWMAVRGNRRRQALDRGFVLSDHADWPGLLDAIASTGAERVGVTHGYSDLFVRYLREECGKDAFVVPTRFTGESALAKEKEETDQ